MWDIDRAPMCLDVASGEVVCVGPHGQVYNVNSSLRSFVDSLDAIEAAAPLSPRNPAYDTYQAAADQVHAVLTSIDPPALADATGFWQTILDDIASGDYDED